MRPSLFPWLALASCLLAGCSTPPPPPSASPSPPTIAPEHQCVKHVRRTGSIKLSGIIHRRTWVVVGYDLDGSAKARNIHLVASESSGEHDADALRLTEATVFEKGVVRTDCQQTFVFNPS